MGLGEDDLRHVFYLSLLQHIGCTAMNHEVAAVVGNEIAMGAAVAALDHSDPDVIAPHLLAVVARAFPGLAAPRIDERARQAGELLPQVGRAVCEVAQLLAERMGFDGSIRLDLGRTSERWDGKGPLEVRGGELSVPMQIVQVCEGAMVAHETGGLDAVLELVPQRGGTWYGPDVAQAVLRDARELLSVLNVVSRWDEVLAAEPGGPRMVSEDRVDDILRAMAEFVDLKSPFLVGHSTGVADLAANAARPARLPDSDALWLRRAAWVHDLGRVGVSASIWGKAGPLSVAEWEQVRLHAYYTDRVLARLSWGHDLVTLASMHHERMDGSGYFRRAPASAQTATARILAAADTYTAMTELRPHRPAFDRKEAAAELRREVRAGRIDPDAAEAVLEAAGEPARRRRTHVAGITARELEVLRLLARGLSTREIAEALVVSPKTADKHIENIYLKAGVSTRAAATLFAIQHDLLG
ncbi:MAG: LuxR C-terminal-related transcriptional regulator [Actinobacteria bacterium]|nr:LuxR C-terminal-related transcriptional regulator [Actinomycetota bacterium]